MRVGDINGNVARYMRDREKFLAIKNDPIRRDSVLGYGVSSFIYAILGLAISYFSYVGANALASANNFGILLSWIVFVPLYVVAFIMPPVCLVYGLKNGIRQLQLKRKLGGALGILVNLASVALAYYLLLTNLGA